LVSIRNLKKNKKKNLSKQRPQKDGGNGSAYTLKNPGLFQPKFGSNMD